MRVAKLVLVVALPCACALMLASQTSRLPTASTVVYAAGHDDDDDGNLNVALHGVLSAAGFTGNIEQTFQTRIVNNLGRPINPLLVDLGRKMWFDKGLSLGRDNTCGGCHSPGSGMGDSQPLAIGVQNNNVVGPHRTGPRNQRRTPTVVNTALYPNMMWNSRFASPTGDPFDNSQGFDFPVPEDTFPFTPVRFSHGQDVLHGVTHLLQAQAHMPPTELIEVAGFKGTCPGGVPDPSLGPRFCQFDLATDPGVAVPLPELSTGSRNEPIRQATLATLNATPAYRALFGGVFPEVAAPTNAPIDFFMFGKAIAEFEFTLVFANAPVDKFARGQFDAMTSSEKRGALVFFGKANCVGCHKVSGQSNEMFSDFQEHVIGVPQIAPRFGKGKGNVIFAGPGEDEDFGREERTGDQADRYKFRTAPLRNLAVSPGFFHNGAYTRLEDAIGFHLSVVKSARNYDPVEAGVPDDLTHRVGPPVPKALIDPLVKNPIKLTDREFDDLVNFVRDGLLDKKVMKKNLCGLLPASVPSGAATMVFEGCPTP
jgi:cytochrome c peroxidase